MKRQLTTSLVLLATWGTSGAHPGLARQSAKQTFSSAAEATQSLFQAVQHGNVQAIANILGGATDLTSSGDEAQDKADRQLFVQKYQEMHRLGREADGSVILYMGAENWPFPIPLIEKNGTWRFDADNGRKEVVFRRIGENELTAIAICHEFVAVERQHHPEANGVSPADSFPANLIASSESGSSNPVLFYGYYFHVLATGGKKAGGFALIAYPAEYRSSGVMTFIVAANDVVYEKDLGANTSALASVMTAFYKDATWHAADE